MKVEGIVHPTTAEIDLKEEIGEALYMQKKSSGAGTGAGLLAACWDPILFHLNLPQAIKYHLQLLKIRLGLTRYNRLITDLSAFNDKQNTDNLLKHMSSKGVNNYYWGIYWLIFTFAFENCIAKLYVINTSNYNFHCRMLHNLEILMYKALYCLCKIRKYCYYKYGNLSRREVKSYSASPTGGTESSSKLLDHCFSVIKTFTGIPAVFVSASSRVWMLGSFWRKWKPESWKSHSALF